MDETDDFIDEPEMLDSELPSLEKTPSWSGFGDDMAQRFLRLRGIMDEDMQEEALERYTQRKAAPRSPASITLALRSAILAASQGPRVHSVPMGAVLSTSAAR